MALIGRTFFYFCSAPRLRNFAMKILLKIYIGLTFLLLLDTALYLYNEISLPGHFSDWALFWTWIILTILVISSNIKKRWTRIYAIGLLGFMIVTMIPM